MICAWTSWNQGAGWGCNLLWGACSSRSWTIGKIQFLAVVGLGSWFSGWLLDGGNSEVIAARPSSMWQLTSRPARQSLWLPLVRESPDMVRPTQENLLKVNDWQPNHGNEIPSYSKVLTMLKGRGNSGHVQQVWEFWAYFKISPTALFNNLFVVYITSS